MTTSVKWHELNEFNKSELQGLRAKAKEPFGDVIFLYWCIYIYRIELQAPCIVSFLISNDTWFNYCKCPSVCSAMSRKDINSFKGSTLIT